jgi:hypothetical protein
MGPQAKDALPILYAAFNPDDVIASADALDAILAIDGSDVAARRVMERYSQLLPLSKINERGQVQKYGFGLCIRLQKHGRRSQWAAPAILEFLRHAEMSWEHHDALRAIAAAGPDAAAAIPQLQAMLEDAKYKDYVEEIQKTIAQITDTSG